MTRFWYFVVGLGLGIFLTTTVQQIKLYPKDSTINSLSAARLGDVVNRDPQSTASPQAQVLSMSPAELFARILRENGELRTYLDADTKFENFQGEDYVEYLLDHYQPAYGKMLSTIPYYVFPISDRVLKKLIRHASIGIDKKESFFSKVLQERKDRGMSNEILVDLIFESKEPALRNSLANAYLSSQSDSDPQAAIERFESWRAKGLLNDRYPAFLYYHASEDTDPQDRPSPVDWVNSLQIKDEDLIKMTSLSVARRIAEDKVERFMDDVSRIQDARIRNSAADGAFNFLVDFYPDKVDEFLASLPKDSPWLKHFQKLYKRSLKSKEPLPDFSPIVGS